MISTRMMIALCVWYAGIVLAALCQKPRDWPRALYFIGAIVISVAVMWMGIERLDEAS
jgi:hypothetical protein